MEVLPGEDIQQVKDVLAGNPRNLCLFVLGINTAYRANELVSITVGQVAHLTDGDKLEIKQSKNGRYRTATVIENAIIAIQDWLAVHPNPESSTPLFWSPKTGEALNSVYLTEMVKKLVFRSGAAGQIRLSYAAEDLGIPPAKDLRPISVATYASVWAFQRMADIGVSMHPARRN